MRRRIELKAYHHSKHLFTLLTVLTLLLLLGAVRQAQAQSQWTTATNQTDIYNNNTGNVGVGTSTPSACLEVRKDQNDVTRLMGLNNASTGGAAQSAFSFYEGSTEKAKVAVNGSGAAGYIGGSNALQIWHFQNAPVVIGTSSIERMRVDGSGNVGIGVTSPAQRLDLGGSLSIYGATVIDNNRILSARSSFNASGTTDGVWNPQARPSTIFTPSSSINTGFIFGYDDEGSGQYTPSLGLSVPTNATDNARVLQVRHFGGTTAQESYNRFEMNASGKLSWGGGTNAVDASLGRSAAGTLGVTGGFNVSGNVAIGGNTNITGTLSATGGITGATINATYQDVAEWVPATQALSAGTVVVLNPMKSNEVMASRKAYDTSVAGVISPRPGLTLGEAGEGKALVATTGRVKVKVDATRAPIHVGDLLVTSDEEGVAMKSEPVDLGGVKLHRPGTLIGKALEPLESGKGEILVLLSLQ